VARRAAPRVASCLNVPLRFVSITARQPFSLQSIAACGNWPPALLTQQIYSPVAVEHTREQRVDGDALPYVGCYCVASKPTGRQRCAYARELFQCSTPTR